MPDNRPPTINEVQHVTQHSNDTQREPEPQSFSRASTFRRGAEDGSPFHTVQAGQVGSRSRTSLAGEGARLQHEIEVDHLALIDQVVQHPSGSVGDIIRGSPRHWCVDKRGGSWHTNILGCAIRESQPTACQPNIDELVEWVALRHRELLAQPVTHQTDQTPLLYAADQKAIWYVSCMLDLFRSTNFLLGVDWAANLRHSLGDGCGLVPPKECHASWTKMLSTGKTPRGDSINKSLIGLLQETGVDQKDCPHAAWRAASSKKVLEGLGDFRDRMRSQLQGVPVDGNLRKKSGCCLHVLLKKKNAADRKGAQDVLRQLHDIMQPLIEVGGKETLECADETGTLPIVMAVHIDPLPINTITKLAQACPKAVFESTDTSPSAYRYVRGLEPRPGRDELLRTFKGLCIEEHGVGSEKVRSILFGGLENIPRMCFDVSAERRVPVDEAYMTFLEQNLKVKFDAVLSVVSLPKWAGALPEDQGAKNRVPSTKVEPWGPYFEPVFKRLHEKHHVRDIHRLEVNDLVPHPHSDEAIGKCIQLFTVKELSWAKVDLSSAVINKAASGVKKLTLHCSGKEAVLFGWTDSENGLVGLKYLEQLMLRIDFVTEGLATEKRYFNEFVKRLNSRRKQLNLRAVVVEVSYTAAQAQKDISRTQLLSLGRPGSGPNRRWIDHMAEFVASLLNYGPKPTTPVKVAVIDDGIQLGHHNFHVATGRSFWRDENTGTSLVKDFWIDSGYHGTPMTEYVVKMCPDAELYIGRLHDLSTTEGMPSFTAESAAEAVEWATSQHVDIISMSWSIKKTDANAEDIKKLEDAINTAHRKDIILFASLSDDKPHPDMSAFPACLNDSVIRIGAATKEGSPFPGIKIADADFLFPGVDVPYEFNGQHDLVTGSSVATALAAGFAALLIYCKRAVGQTAKITQRDIVSMFRRIRRGEDRYLEVWRVFQKLEPNTGAGKKRGLDPKGQLGEILAAIS